MIALYLIAAHMVGDFVLQTRGQAANKFDDPLYRMRHVLAYCLPFWPIAFAYEGGSFWNMLAFMEFLYFFHFATDSRRFKSTLGDVVAWKFAREPGSLEPNPWAPISIMIDQALHLCQIAVFAGLFLR